MTQYFILDSRVTIEEILLYLTQSINTSKEVEYAIGNKDIKAGSSIENATNKLVAR
jgi:hypothetical protein